MKNKLIGLGALVLTILLLWAAFNYGMGGPNERAVGALYFIGAIVSMFISIAHLDSK